MRPQPTIQNVIDRSEIDTKGRCQRTLGNPSLLVNSSDLSDLSFRKNVHWVTFSRFGVWFSPASFILTVLNVFRCRSKEKMIWVAARWIVATMTNIKRLVKVSVGKNKRDTMSRPVSSSESNPPVFVADTRLPRPAFIGSTFFHLAPEANFDRLSLHSITQLIVCHALGCANSARAFSFSQNPI
jgi:hypothetical protein